METKDILIVEDEALIAFSLKERIENFGYRVTGIIDRGEDVVPEIEKNTPDLILMDINLKGEQDGIETAGMVRQHQDIPIIFLTSYSNQGIIDRAKKTGPYGYVIKTVDDNNLHISIDMALNKHLSNQQVNNQLNKEIRKLKSLYDNNVNMVVRMDVEGCIEYVNPVFIRLMGIHAGELLGVRLEDSTMNDQAKILFAEFSEKVIQKKRKVTMEGVIQTILGDRMIRITAIPEKNDQGEVESILAVISDDTDQQLAVNNMRNKQKKINESINYSMQIQSAIFPQLNLLHNYFEEAFIINKPKDKIGGDFPWVNKVGNSIYLGAIDCTGHGVPGALMSLVTYFLMDKINSNAREIPAGKVLDLLHLFVNRSLKQHYDMSKSRDGADVSLCRINITTGKLEYAGAHRPLFLYRDGNLIEIKGDRYPIGGNQYKNRERFKNHYLDLQDNDIVFMFSDGLPDQFGKDEKGQVSKFGMKRIRSLITGKTSWEISDLSTALEQRISTWQGTQSQTDDILAIGMKFKWSVIDKLRYA
ncbi:MAG: response regulator [Cyclobacteriaceae bacterium]|nr:response regulator [Cyclobacteriaceae bacterium]